MDTRVDLHGSINTFSLYAADTLSLGKSLAFTVLGPLQPDDASTISIVCRW